MNGMPWRPAMTKRTSYSLPPVGELVAINRRAWRVVAVTEVEPALWTERDEEIIASSPGAVRPYFVTVTKPDGTGEVHEARVPASRYASRAWHVLPEHYAVCVSCGDLAPCREHQRAVDAERRVDAAVKAMRIPDGACPSCSEPITHRQKTHHFPGPNLLNPLGADGVSFHARWKCAGGAAAYEEMWVSADPTRKRSLLTLRCDGTLVVHGDGSAECFGRRDGEDCPTVYAAHRGICACYAQSHGCGRGCARAGHPGTRLAVGLTPDGYFPTGHRSST